MDLNELDLTKSADIGAVMEVMHPITGESLADKAGNIMTLTLVGIDSKRLREAMKVRARIEMAKRKPAKFDLDDAENKAAELLAACTIGWSNVIEGGVEVEFSEDNVKRIYLKYGWLRQQADAFINDRVNFFKA